MIRNLKVFPLIYCLMTRKTADAYRAVFKFVEERLFKMEPGEFMTDFEDGMRLAIRQHWPNVRIRGCWFHLKRAISNKCTSLGMGRVLKTNRNARKLKKMLGNIPLLPENQIVEGYSSIKDIAHKKKLSKSFGDLFSYFERYWLKQVRLVFLLIH